MTRRVWKRTTCLAIVAIVVIAVVLWSLQMVSDAWLGGRVKHILVVRHRHEPVPRSGGSDQTAESNRTAEGVYELLRTMLRTAPACVDDALLVILITTAPDHAVQRAAIRHTWCAASARAEREAGGDDEIDALSHHFQCVFLIGSTDNATTKRSIDAEMAAYGDIAKGSYVDSYRNLTSKVLAGFHWCVRHCGPRFVLKTDDDCFVNVAVLLRLIAMQGDDDVYVGKVFSSPADTLVIRNARNRWAVSERDYPPVYYPPYASGIGYLLSHGAMRRILAESRRVPAFPNEDAYIGVLADQAGVAPTNSYRFTFISDKWTVCNYMYLVVLHNVTALRQGELWGTARRAATECRRQTFITTWD